MHMNEILEKRQIVQYHPEKCSSQSIHSKFKQKHFIMFYNALKRLTDCLVVCASLKIENLSSKCESNLENQA